MSQSDHVSIPEVVALLDADCREQVFAVVPRVHAVALLLLSQSTREVVIAEVQNGRWTLPDMRSRTGWTYPTERPPLTKEPTVIAQLSITQSAGPSSQPPQTAWTAVTGVAPRDVEIVSVRSTIDSYPAAVSPDGIFLALLRAPWGDRPRITVVTADQRRIEVDQPAPPARADHY